jgi:hypothetical protein
VCANIEEQTHQGVTATVSFLRELMGGRQDFLGRPPMRHKRRKGRTHLVLQALSLAPRFLIGVVQIHLP